jgi:hypothetical protein
VDTTIRVYPTLVSRGQKVSIHINRPIEATLVDNSGRRVRTFKFSGTTHMDTKNLAAGTYYLILRSARTLNRHQFVVME